MNLRGTGLALTGLAHEFLPFGLVALAACADEIDVAGARLVQAGEQRVGGEYSPAFGLDALGGGRLRGGAALGGRQGGRSLRLVNEPHGRHVVTLEDHERDLARRTQRA